jgi:hypothetical protein
MTSEMPLYKCVYLNSAIVYKCIDYRMCMANAFLANLRLDFQLFWGGGGSLSP